MNKKARVLEKSRALSFYLYERGKLLCGIDPRVLAKSFIRL